MEQEKKICVAGDHAAFERKGIIKAYLERAALTFLTAGRFPMIRTTLIRGFPRTWLKGWLPASFRAGCCFAARAWGRP